VDLDTIESFFRAGCSAVGVGSSLVQPKLVDSGDWGALSALAQKFTSLALSFRTGSAKPA
jgi:2-keto-3-deoxy-6-phosphogluconate aldolase